MAVEVCSIGTASSRLIRVVVVERRRFEGFGRVDFAGEGQKRGENR